VDSRGIESTCIKCTIEQNTLREANAYGAGMFLSFAAKNEIINCTVTENENLGSNGAGGGIYWNSGDLNLINSLIAGNHCPDGKDIYADNALGNFTQTSSLVESCTNGIGIHGQGGGNCPTFSFSSANLAPVTTCNGHSYYAPQSGGQALDNATAPGSLGIPTTDICGGLRLAPHDIGSFDVAANPTVAPVPTLSEWAMIVLALLMGVMATLALQAQQGVTTVPVETSHALSLQNPSRLPFDKRQYTSMLLLTLLATCGVFAIAIIAFGYELTHADAPGVIIATPIAAYLLYLWNR